MLRKAAEMPIANHWGRLAEQQQIAATVWGKWMYALHGLHGLLCWIGLALQNLKDLEAKVMGAFFVADDFPVHFGMMFKFRISLQGCNSKTKSPDPWASNFVQVFFFKLWRHNLFFKPLLETCRFRHLLVPLWTWRFGREHGWKWIQRPILGRWDPFCCWFLPSNSAWSLPREFNQQNAGDFLQNTVVPDIPKTTNRFLDVFPTLVNYGVLNYQPVRFGRIYEPSIGSISSIHHFGGLGAPQTFSSGFESPKREAKEANPVLGPTEKLRIHKPLMER